MTPGDIATKIVVWACMVISEESLRYERESIDPQTGEVRLGTIVSIEERRVGA